jgi:hypothetical protein
MQNLKRPKCSPFTHIARIHGVVSKFCLLNISINCLRVPLSMHRVLRCNESGGQFMEIYIDFFNESCGRVRNCEGEHEWHQNVDGRDDGAAAE